MMRYSFFSLLRNSLTRHERWPRAWRSPDPRPSYDIVIVGGGGHGLATAYYLAKNHGIRNVAVLERGAIGLGNTGRNTTVVRSNYLCDDSAHLYEHALKLWEGLSRELNFNTMFSQRGVVNLAFTRHELDDMERRASAMRLNGIDCELLSLADLKRWIPILNLSGTMRYPVLGGIVQPRGGNARHDAIAWGYARAADGLGVDIIENCAVTGIRVHGGRAVGVETTRGYIGAGRIGVAAAGHASVVMAMAGVRLPILSYPLQALVSEPVKPVLHTVVMCGHVHVYLSQSDKGELVIGAARDTYVSYAQRGSFHLIEEQMRALIEVFPIFSRLRMMRQWAGIVDCAPDASPIIGATPVKHLYVNCGWGTGGFKATPGSGWVFAHTIANDAPHPLNRNFSFERFATGRLIDEAAAAGVAH
ncbi:MAG: sarcosine oxidase subunit beta family protein [Betaproteobacteria bacterium]|nr:sarcosine oxidase subunit beta family protein [Betaproteobacteria bacterium]MBI3937359.1 sarcosine oxidase subunit beta family protein [Betaproteobacteria bacterium]